MNAILRRICPNHPHLFKFIDCLRLHELSKSIDMLETVRSDAPVERLHRRRLLKNKRRNSKIKDLTHKLEVGILTPSKFFGRHGKRGCIARNMYDNHLYFS